MGHPLRCHVHVDEAYRTARAFDMSWSCSRRGECAVCFVQLSAGTRRCFFVAMSNATVLHWMVNRHIHKRNRSWTFCCSASIGSCRSWPPRARTWPGYPSSSTASLVSTTLASMMQSLSVCFEQRRSL